jgi:leader peptidase (prepilin peptidase) / N-methyltransferase
VLRRRSRPCSIKVYPNGGCAVTTGSRKHRAGGSLMNGAFALAWALVGAVAGVTLAPSTAWLAARPQRAFYPGLMAGGTAAAFAVLALRYSMPGLLTLSVFAAVGLQLAVVDVRAQRLPRVLIWPDCVAVGALLTTQALDRGTVNDLVRAALAAIALAGSYLVLALTSRGGLGAGDVRAAVLVGGVLGWHGWQAVLTGATLGFSVTGVAAIIRVATRRERVLTPHGTGMFAGSLAALLLL